MDGGKGLLAALPTVYHGTPVQRCWAHKIRNVLSTVRAADHEAGRAALACGDPVVSVCPCQAGGER